MVKNYAFKCESGLSAPPFEKIRRSDNSDECVWGRFGGACAVSTNMRILLQSDLPKR